MTREEQSELFIKTARELGVDETGAEFERAFAKVAPPKSAASADHGLPGRDRKPS